MLIGYVSFLNKEEIESFFNLGSKDIFKNKEWLIYDIMQKIQIILMELCSCWSFIWSSNRDENGVQPYHDKNIENIDEIIKELSFECVGWIFTNLKEKGVALWSYDIHKTERYQQEYMINHPSGCKISRYITLNHMMLEIVKL